MGSAESKVEKRKPAAVARHQRSPYQPQQDDSSDSIIEARYAIFVGMLVELLDNDSNLNLPYPRRIALLESIHGISRSSAFPPNDLHQHLTEIIMEGILTCDSLSAEEKNLVVIDGLLEQRWDRVIEMYPSRNSDTHCTQSQQGNLHESFLRYRHMILVLLRSSRKMQQLLPEESRQRVKHMIVKTENQAELDDLLQRILERTCGVDFQKKITSDMTSCRYYRLVWPDRLDCENSSSLTYRDSKLPPSTSTTGSNTVYVGSLLSDDLSRRQDCCPICLDPIQSPALELSCHHVFCSRCISNWIVQQQSPRPFELVTSVNNVRGKWHCPVCRNVWLLGMIRDF